MYLISQYYVQVTVALSTKEVDYYHYEDFQIFLHLQCNPTQAYSTLRYLLMLTILSFDRSKVWLIEDSFMISASLDYSNFA